MDGVFSTPNGETTKGTGYRERKESVEREGKKYLRTRTWWDGGPFPLDFTKLSRKDARGIYSIGEEPGAKERVEVPWPLAVGMTWVTIEGTKRFMNTVAALETVTIGEKKYDRCYRVHVESSDGGYIEDFWEAPQIGNVKSEIIYNKGHKITLTLREFKRGGAAK